MSLEKLAILIFLKDLTSLTVWGLVWEGTLRSKVMAWWSEMERSNSKKLDATVLFDLGFKRSKVWPLTGMGKLLCWERWNALSRVINGAQLGSVGVSTWILIFPRKTFSEGRETTSSSKFCKFWKKFCKFK